MKKISKIVLLLFLTLISSQAFAKKENAKSQTVTVPNEKYDDIAMFGKVINFVDKQYVDKVNTKELVYGAIKGMLETLDPHSSFMPPEIYRQLKTDTAGKFGGLGIEVWINKDGVLTVVTPMDGTPAWKAGIKAGDKIIKIDGHSTKGMSIAEATAKIRGDIGEAIKFTIQRAGVSKDLEFNLKRVSINLKSVKKRDLGEGLGYIRLTHFQEKSHREVLDAIESLEKKNKLKGLIIDLRSNPGGLLDEAVEIANLFIDDGVIVSTIGRNPEDKEVKVAKSGIARKDLPLVTLVNGSSASAAEILAGALKDHKRGLVVGQRTFGKGSVQTVIPLGDDVGLKLTIAKYYTPNGISIQARGIDPDIEIDELDQSAIQKVRKKVKTMSEADLKNHINGENEEKSEVKESDESESAETSTSATVTGDPKTDYQVRQALNLLKTLVFKDSKR
ncbi:MAG: S41 family peptidase [Oligoflexia bacterium]|nr:S41 family peptidase [Oligoflexia bacterium]